MRRAKESLLVITAGAVFTFCTPPAAAEAVPQAGKAERPQAGARTTRDNRKGAGGTRDNRKANTSHVAGGNEPAASPTPAPTGTPPGAGTGAQAAATQPDGPPAQPPPEVKAGEADRPGGGTDIAAAARRSLERWGLPAAAAGTALGLVILVGYTFRLHRRLADLGDELEAVKRQARGGQEIFLPKRGAAQSAAALADKVFDQGAVAESGPGGEEWGPTANAPPVIPADAFSELTERVEKIEKQLQSAAEARAHRPPEAEAEDLNEIEAPTAARPPQRVTVDKMVEWANSAGLRLEPVKATVGLFGNFGQSADGDNWLAIADGDSYLFPRVNRFESASHFKSDYLDYYDCDQPSAGTVVIDRPATMSGNPQGGWKLVNRGKLSVAAS